MKNKTKKAFVFDFDDTLAFTDAGVLVLGPGGVGGASSLVGSS